MSESKQEGYKRESLGLRGNIASELDDTSSGFVSDESYELLKFFGSYQGYDRDTATPRKKQGLEKEWEFMLRLKMPAGRLTAKQYLALDKYCDARANGSLRITTRQTFQFHQILKGDLKPFIKEISAELLSTMGGCGDVVRNITACPAPIKDGLHEEMLTLALQLAKHLAPRTDAYWDMFVDGQKQNYPFNPETDSTTEDIYGDTYMPRKFKISVIDPRDNCTDALTNDLAFIADIEREKIIGYHVVIGGGMGMKHNTPATYPRLATPITYIAPQDAQAMAEAVVKLQRDYGDRENRQHARLKYVVAENGNDWVRKKLADYFEGEILPIRPLPKLSICDHMGWHSQNDGNYFLGIPIPSGRIIDIESGEYAGAKYRTGLHAVISKYQMNLTLTADQNIILTDIKASDKLTIEHILRDHGIRLNEDITHIARHFHACVSLPTCGKGLAESERVEIPLVKQLEKLFDKHGLIHEEIAIRIAGCPNGCSRPYGGEIGIVGRMPGKYLLYLGGEYNGTRLGTAAFDKVPLEQITDALDPILARFVVERSEGEKFGDFCHRIGWDDLKAQALPHLTDYKWAA
ncbi:MAG: NADPH-dependent assimilatory sulfite reductase hemoprotein subunit [Rickettsiales bacterium]|nr:NADPH-dependent assimilatory sulfite reductase hemoprotein subunit [Rickettsiales bacterium]